MSAVRQEGLWRSGSGDDDDSGSGGDGVLFIPWWDGRGCYCCCFRCRCCRFCLRRLILLPAAAFVGRGATSTERTGAMSTHLGLGEGLRWLLVPDNTSLLRAFRFHRALFAARPFSLFFTPLFLATDLLSLSIPPRSFTVYVLLKLVNSYPAIVTCLR